MANRKLIPLKDEPVVPLYDLQELLAENLDAMEKLHKVLTDRYCINQSKSIRELLEQLQHNFEQEEKEAIAQDKLTPQECYSRLTANYTTVLEQYKMV